MRADRVKPGHIVKDDKSAWQVVVKTERSALGSVALLYADGSDEGMPPDGQVEAVRLSDHQASALRQAASDHGLRHVMNIGKLGRYWAGGGATGWRPATMRPLLDCDLIGCDGPPGTSRVDIYRPTPSGRALLDVLDKEKAR